MRGLKLLAGLVAALLIPAGALAATPDGQDITLSQGDNRTGTYYAFAQTVTVDGNVDGDVVCAGQTVVINGEVKGDVLCAAQNLTVNGPVTGSVRVAGQIVTLNNTVGRNVTALAQNFTLGTDAKVSGELSVAGQSVTLSGPVTGAVYIGAESLKLNSSIGGNLTAYAEQIDLGKSATVAGNVDYTSESTQNLDKAKIEGQVVHHSPATPARHEPTAADRFEMLLYWVAAVLLGALLAVWLAPRAVRNVTNVMMKRWGASLGWGALVVLVGPLALFVVALSVIGLPAAVALGLLWVLAIMSSGVLAGVAVGRLAWQRDDDSPRALALAALAGVPLVVIAHWLPWLGVLVGLGVGLWAVGGLVLAAAAARKD